MIRLSRALLVGIVLLLAATHAWAQATAQINGTVADSSGGVLPGVTVVAIQTETGFRREAVSDETGVLFAAQPADRPLSPGSYARGLPHLRADRHRAAGQQQPGHPGTLQLGSLEETVSVEASAPLVETRNPAIGAVIDNEEVEALPLEGRNPASLIIIAGAAVDTGNPSSRSLTGSRGIAIAGGQPFGVAYLLDGALHNNVWTA